MPAADLDHELQGTEFQSLPSELLTDVFSVIDPKDLLAAPSLVSHVWNQLSASSTASVGLYVDETEADAEQLAKWFARLPQRLLDQFQLTITAAAHSALHSIFNTLLQHGACLQRLHLQIDKLDSLDIAALVGPAGKPAQQTQHLVLCCGSYDFLTTKRLLPPDALQQLSSAFTQLRSLTIHNFEIGTEDIRTLEQTTKLTSLQLNYCVQAKQPIPALPPSLRRLNIHWHPSPNQAPLAIANLTALTLLQLSCSWSLEPLVLPHLSKLQQLQHLDLAHQRSISPAAISALTNLTHLNLSGAMGEAAQGPEQLPPLAAFSLLTCLKSLDLQRCKVRDLSPLSVLTSLTYLNLSGAALGATETEDSPLVPLAALQKLQHLDISKSHAINISPLSALTALTYLSISTDPSASNPSAGVVSSFQQLQHFEAVADDHAARFSWSFETPKYSCLTLLTQLTVLDFSGMNKEVLTSMYPTPEGDVESIWEAGRSSRALVHFLGHYPDPPRALQRKAVAVAAAAAGESAAAETTGAGDPPAAAAAITPAFSASLSQGPSSCSFGMAYSGAAPLQPPMPGGLSANIHTAPFAAEASPVTGADACGMVPEKPVGQLPMQPLPRKHARHDIFGFAAVPSHPGSAVSEIPGLLSRGVVKLIGLINPYQNAGAPSLGPGLLTITSQISSHPALQNESRAARTEAGAAAEGLGGQPASAREGFHGMQAPAGLQRPHPDQRALNVQAAASAVPFSGAATMLLSGNPWAAAAAAKPAAGMYGRAAFPPFSCTEQAAADSGKIDSNMQPILVLDEKTDGRLVSTAAAAKGNAVFGSVASMPCKQPKHEQFLWARSLRYLCPDQPVLPLVKLCLPFMGLLDRDIVNHVLLYRLTLQTLDLSGNRFLSPLGLAPLAALSSLTSLDVSNIGAKDSTVGPLCLLTQLRHLNLRENHLGDSIAGKEPTAPEAGAAAQEAAAPEAGGAAPEAAAAGAVDSAALAATSLDQPGGERVAAAAPFWHPLAQLTGLTRLQLSAYAIPDVAALQQKLEPILGKEVFLPDGKRKKKWSEAAPAALVCLTKYWQAQVRYIEKIELSEPSKANRILSLVFSIQLTFLGIPSMSCWHVEFCLLPIFCSGAPRLIDWWN